MSSFELYTMNATLIERDSLTSSLVLYFMMLITVTLTLSHCWYDVAVWAYALRLRTCHGLGSDARHDDCAICLEQLSNKKTVRLQCDHVFHATCVARWFETSGETRCPLCLQTHPFWCFASKPSVRLARPLVWHLWHHRTSVNLL